jgi:DNA mismatch repair protein MutS
LTDEPFVPNDTQLMPDAAVHILTGPNMAGKSTFLRQVALITLMAQIGSFIPAREAAISPVDRIFTRIGASDDLVSGQSTFMVEMNEVAQILKYATKDSLVILDEIGRGTSTFDGMSIARAVIEHIEKKVHAKTLFATHYHELTDLEDDKIKNFCVAVKERGNQVAFLRRIVRGAADKSYGIHVARLAAEAPDAAAAARAEQAEGRAAKAEPAAQDMGSLFASSLSDTLLALDVMTMTPLEAMNELYRLQEQAKREAGKA